MYDAIVKDSLSSISKHLCDGYVVTRQSNSHSPNDCFLQGRHARASNCFISLQRSNVRCSLSIVIRLSVRNISELLHPC
jgi:hypothetical protein